MYTIVICLEVYRKTCSYKLKLALEYMGEEKQPVADDASSRNLVEIHDVTSTTNLFNFCCVSLLFPIFFVFK